MLFTALGLLELNDDIYCRHNIHFKQVMGTPGALCGPSEDSIDPCKAATPPVLASTRITLMRRAPSYGSGILAQMLRVS